MKSLASEQLQKINGGILPGGCVIKYPFSLYELLAKILKGGK